MRSVFKLNMLYNLLYKTYLYGIVNIMKNESFGEYINTATLLHNQAMFEANNARRQRNVLLIGSLATSVTSGVLQGADIINGYIEWGPRVLSIGLIMAGIKKGIESYDAKSHAKNISKEVRLTALNEGISFPAPTTL